MLLYKESVATSGADLHPYIQEDERFDARFSASVRRIWVTGAFLAVMMSVAQISFSIFLQSTTEDEPTSSPQELLASLRLGIGTAESTTLSVGLLAATATLAVAVVASAWRPVSDDPRAEVPVARAVSVFVLGGRLAASMAVAVAMLALPEIGVVIVCAVIAFVASFVSAAVTEREDELRRALKVEYRRRYIKLLEARIYALTVKRPWLKECQHRRRQIVAYYLIPWVTVALASAATLFLAVLSDAQDPLRPFIGVLLIGTLTGLAATVCAYLATTAVETRWVEGEHVTARIYSTLVILFVVLSLSVFLGLSWERDQVILKAVAVLPVVTFIVLTAMGSQGRGSGRSLWTSAASKLRLELDQKREVLSEDEDSVRPSRDGKNHLSDETTSSGVASPPSESSIQEESQQGQARADLGHTRTTHSREPSQGPETSSPPPSEDLESAEAPSSGG